MQLRLLYSRRSLLLFLPFFCLSLSVCLSEIILAPVKLIRRRSEPLICITYRRNADNREIDITGSPPRCRAMSPLPRICIQAYADKQHDDAAAAATAAHSNALTTP